MKKLFFVVAIATLFFSCQKELEPTKEATNDRFSFKASIEQLSEPTRGTINDDNQLVWYDNGKTGDDRVVDKIGIYVNDDTWTDKNQPFTLSSGAGTTQGVFTWDYSGTFSDKAAAAFYPWQGLGSGYNNVYDNETDGPVMYFKLKDEVWGYNSGDMLTPLIASLSGSTDPISFKHAGAAVKLTINNLVSGTYVTKMTVAGKQITGGFHVNPANAGTDALALDAAEDATKNTVTLHAWKSSGAFSWVFPVPELTKPKLSFEIKDDNGVTVFSKNLKAQTKDVKRGEILVMPALDITPYSKFVQDNTTWTFSGTINGSAWTDNVPMMTDGKYSILSGCTFAAGDEFKIRYNNAWDTAYPSSNWVFNASNAGTKDIIFNRETHEIKVVDHKFPYPSVDLSSLSSSSITIDGNMSDWSLINSLASTGTSRFRSWKFSSDNDNLYFYFVLRKNRMSTAKNLTIGFSWDDTGNYSGDNLAGLEAIVSFQPFTNEVAGVPGCVNGTINSATINGTAVSDAGIKAYGLNLTDSTEDDADYYLEVSIPKAKVPGLPASGSIQVGAGYDYYKTDLQDVTL